VPAGTAPRPPRSGRGSARRPAPCPTSQVPWSRSHPILWDQIIGPGFLATAPRKGMLPR
jgi:hypothetical protein